VLRPLLTICAIALLAPAAAAAQAPAPTEIDGNPLNIWTDADGSIQVNVDGFTAGEWFPPSSFDQTTGQPIPNPVANQGFGIVVDPGGSPQFFGKFIAGSMGTPTSGPTLVPGNPTAITTSWSLPDPNGAPRLEVTQTLTYTNGQRQFDATYSVKNVSSARVTFRASVAGDMAIRGSDTGVGFLIPGPPRFIGGQNQEVGAAGGFVENPSSPWSHFQEGPYSDISRQISDVSSTGGLNDTLVTDSIDNGAGVEWDDHAAANPLAPGDTAVYSVAERYIDTLGITPPTSHKLTGEDASLQVSTGSLSGAPLANKTIDYTVEGANFLTGKTTTNAQGQATISYIGGVPGNDTVTAFVDTNGNGTRDPNESQAQATVEWEGPPPPVIGEAADVRPVSGKVKIKLPKGTSLGKARALGLTGAAAHFVPLTTAKQIPMGSTLDTSRGTVSLLSSAGTSKNTGATKFQSGNFNGGQFRVTQGRKNPLTQLSMGGGGFSACRTRVPRGGSAARTHRRRLFGNAHGRFRTRGRNSSATVRGTKWSMTDTCAGTLTAVSRGVVVVRDFTLKKNKTVKAGHHYFARAPKLRKKH
jgi:hypothetical protein